MTVDEIMTKKVIYVNPESRINEIAGLLFNNNITGMPVVDGDRRVVGIITEADLISRETKIHIPSYIKFLKNINCLKSEKNPKVREQCQKILDVKAADIMTTETVCVNSDLPIEELADIFIKKRINPIPVTKNNKLVGIVSRADLIKLIK